MNKTVQSFTIVTGFSVATRLISFLFKIWMSRSLGAEIVGLYQICLSVLLLLFTFTAGAPTVLSRKVAAAHALGDFKRRNALTSASILMGVALAGVICAVFYAFSNKLGFLFTDERCMGIFLIMLPALITSTLYSSIRSWFWGQKRFLAFSSTEFIDEIFKIVLSILFAGGLISTLSGAKGVALAFTLSDLLCVLILLIMFFAAGGRFTKPRGCKELLSATIPLSATRILTSLTASLTALVIPERLVAAGMTVSAATAAYGRVAGMAFPLIMAPITLISALSVVLTPDIAELSAKGETVLIRQKLLSSLTFAMLVSAAFFAVYLPLGREVGFLIFGDKNAGEFVSYCAPLLFPVAVAQVTTPVLNSLGLEKHTFINSLIGGLTILPCIFFLPEVIGVYAMAAGSGMCFLTTSVLNLILLVKKLGKLGNVKKNFAVVGFAIALGVLGLFSERLLSPFAGEIVTSLVLLIFIVFLMFSFVSAFDVVDFAGYIRMFKPSVSVAGLHGRLSAGRNRRAEARKMKKLRRAKDRT